MNFSSRLEFILSAVTHAKLWVLLGKLCLCLEHERNSAGEWLREGTFREERLGERALNHCRPTLCLFRCSPSHPASDKPVWAKLLTPKHGFKIRPTPNNCYNKRNSGFFPPWHHLWFDLNYESWLHLAGHCLDLKSAPLSETAYVPCTYMNS